MSVYVKRNSVTIPYTTSDSWTILSPIELSIKQKIEAVGTPLKEWDIRINYGIKTGCNEAFIIDGATRARLIAADPKSAEIIRPILRGRDIKRYGYEWAGLYVILASFGSYKWLEEKYPVVYNHLLQHKTRLENRGQCRYTASGKPNLSPNAPYIGQHHWLELDNNPRSDYLDDFSKQKIVWGNLNLTAQYALANEVIFVNAPSPIITPGSEYLLAFLNSSVGDWWIKLLGVGRSGGFIEYKPMFVETFPIPLPNNETNKRIMDIVHVRQSVENAEEIEQCEKKINQMIYSIYCFKEEEIAVIEDFNINPEIII